MAWNPLSSYPNSLADSFAEQAETLREQFSGRGYAARLMQEQMRATQALASPWLARDADAFATSVVNMQHLIDEAQTPHRFLVEELRRHENEHRVALQSLAYELDEPLRRAQRDIDQWRESILASSLAHHGSLFGMSPTGLAEQLSAGLGAMHSSLLAEQFGQAIAGLDLDAIWQAAQGVTDRLWDALPDDIESVDEFEEAVSQSQLDAFRAVVEDVVGKAVDKAQASSNAATALAWRLFYFGLVLALLQILIPLVTQSLTEKVPQASPPDSRPNASARPRQTRGGVVVALRDTTLHAGPSSRQSVMGSVRARQFVEVVRRQHGWLLVEHVPPEGDSVLVRGWVRVRHTRQMDAELTRLLWCALTQSPQPDICSEP